jgi:hypothetical protein
VVRIVDHGGSMTVIGPQVVRRFDGDSAALLRAVLEIHPRPIRRAVLLAALAVRAGLVGPEAPAAAAGDVAPVRWIAGPAGTRAQVQSGSRVDRVAAAASCAIWQAMLRIAAA